MGAPAAAEVEETIDKHLANVRREAIDILRVHHYAYLQNEGLAERIAECKAKGKVRALCLIRHMLADQQAYAARGPNPRRMPIWSSTTTSAAGRLRVLRCRRRLGRRADYEGLGRPVG